MSHGPLVFTSLVTTTRNYLVIAHQPERDSFKLNLRNKRGEVKEKKTDKKTPTNIHKTPPMYSKTIWRFPLPSPHLHKVFVTFAANVLSQVSCVRYGHGPCRNGPDEARKTLMFIKRSLNRFHRCQSGKVTVTAPIRKTAKMETRALMESQRWVAILDFYTPSWQWKELRIYSIFQ